MSIYCSYITTKQRTTPRDETIAGTIQPNKQQHGSYQYIILRYSLHSMIDSSRMLLLNVHIMLYTLWKLIVAFYVLSYFAVIIFR